MKGTLPFFFLPIFKDNVFALVELQIADFQVCEVSLSCLKVFFANV